MAEPLRDDLRRVLESTVKKAREAAEDGARAALEGLAVHRHEPFSHLDPGQRELRVQLRAHARQLGDTRDATTGAHRIDRLVAQTAYEHWHRMLFARFLAESSLLMHPDGVAVTLDECDELAAEDGAADGWDLACRYASRMLPQIFRPAAPELKVRLAPEHQRALEGLVAGLGHEVFTASDSLGWVYQYWQAKRKEEINASEVKIGAEELPAVTQLFTEPYMVQFLLHNTLGAWWAGKILASNPELAASAADEDELRAACALPGYEWTYLRFVRDGEDGPWRPAAGVFEGWPKRAAEITMLDPCCGSGHFLVEMLQIIARMRMAEEGLSPAEAVDAALRDNIHGLEIDERCTQIAAFALAFAAWTFPGAGGFRPLPALHVACSGLALASKKEEWLALADTAAAAGGMPATKNLFGTDESLMSSRLKGDLSALYDLFKDAPTLGSLIEPRALLGEMYQADFGALQALLAAAVANESDPAHVSELAVAAQGMACAADLLAGRYHCINTNVPYLARGKQGAILQDYCKMHYPEAKKDLATAFLDRCLELCLPGGSAGIVLPQNWLFLTSYRNFREKLLQRNNWNIVARLGPRAFQTISGEVVNVALLGLTTRLRDQEGSIHNPKDKDHGLFCGLDASEQRTVIEKAAALAGGPTSRIDQANQLLNPNITISLDTLEHRGLLVEFAESVKGLTTGDGPRFIRYITEFDHLPCGWEYFQTTPRQTSDFGGMTQAFYWENGHGAMQDIPGSRTYARGAWGSHGVLLSQMGTLPATRYLGVAYDNNCAVIKPKNQKHLPAFWVFCSSPEFSLLVRKIDQSIKPTNATFERIRFDIDHWIAVAAEMFPSGLPEPYSEDLSQWIFHGHPAKSNEPLHVAVARLLGYRWAAELDQELDLSAEARAWVAKTADLVPVADEDGIVCIPSVRGEEPGASRVQSLLAAAFGDDWSPSKLDAHLDQVGYRGKALERWLRDAFFEQHCKLFHHRPFIWQVWDGTSDGFSALVNYHKLDRALLETLIYSYLGDWIGRQQDAARRDVSGAEERVAAARALQQRLVLILEGESPYDIFVRWKPIEEQPLGWNPDLDDGVRLNIRPFLTVPDIGRKGAGVLRWKPNVKWNKDRGTDPEGMPWHHLGPTYGGKPGDRINDHHLTLEEKRRARLAAGSRQ